MIKRQNMSVNTKTIRCSYKCTFVGWKGTCGSF